MKKCDWNAAIAPPPQPAPAYQPADDWYRDWPDDFSQFAEVPEKVEEVESDHEGADVSCEPPNVI